MTPCARRMRVHAFGTLGVLCAAVCSATSSLWVALVSRYDMRIYVETGMTLVTTIALGKPSPLVGQIIITNPAWFSPLQPNTRMVARVVAVGPTGEAASTVSNPFGTAGPPAAPTAALVRK